LIVLVPGFGAEDFKWKEHINNTCKKASSTLGFLRRNLQHCPRACRRTVYIALVRSIMEYGSITWDPYTKQEIAKLESRNPSVELAFLQVLFICSFHLRSSAMCSPR
jgi:hypothetical protein